MPNLPLKYETASKYAYLAMVLGAFASVIVAASWAHDQWGGVAMAMILTAGVVGAGILGSLGAEGLAAYWRRRRDAEMLKEVDRLKQVSLNRVNQPVVCGTGDYMEARKAITDWEDRLRD